MTIEQLLYGVVTALLAIIGWMAMVGLRNNTKAMERLSDSLNKIEEKIGTHETRLENHEVRLEKGGL